MSDFGPFVERVMPNGWSVFYRESDHSYHSEIHEVKGKWTAVQSSRLAAVSSIVNVLHKEALLDWAANLAFEGENWRDVRGQAATRGTNTHDLVLRALIARANLADLPDEHRPWGQAAFRWLRTRQPKVLDAEYFVASIEHGFAGRSDLFGRFTQFPIGAIPLPKGLARVDFKTVTKWSFYKGTLRDPFPENALQLDLYEAGAVESGYESADYGLVVRLGPDGRFDETPVELDPDRGLAILGAYRARAAAVSALKTGLPEPEAVAA